MPDGRTVNAFGIMTGDHVLSEGDDEIYLDDLTYTMGDPLQCARFDVRDFNEDCTVNLADFAIFINSWLFESTAF